MHKQDFKYIKKVSISERQTWSAEANFINELPIEELVKHPGDFGRDIFIFKLFYLRKIFSYEKGLLRNHFSFFNKCLE